MYTVKLYSSNRCFISNAYECRSHIWNCDAFTGSLLLAMRRHCTSSRAHKGTAANFVPTKITNLWLALFQKRTVKINSRHFILNFRLTYTLAVPFISRIKATPKSHRTLKYFPVLEYLMQFCNDGPAGSNVPFKLTSNTASPLPAILKITVPRRLDTSTFFKGCPDGTRRGRAGSREERVPCCVRWGLRVLHPVFDS